MLLKYIENCNIIVDKNIKTGGLMMGLIVCPDCKREFSDRIDNCPFCGCPKEEALREMKYDKKEDYKKDEIEYIDEMNFVANNNENKSNLFILIVNNDIIYIRL